MRKFLFIFVFIIAGLLVLPIAYDALAKNDKTDKIEKALKSVSDVNLEKTVNAVVNTTKKTIEKASNKVEEVYDEAKDFTKGNGVIDKKPNTAVSSILKKGETLLRENVSIVPSCGGHCVPFIQGAKIGFALNSSNLMVVTPAEFDDVYNENFYESNNLAIVKKNGKWGAYNCSTFEIDIPCIYDKLSPFRNGKTTAILNGETFIIDVNGNRIN